MKIAIKNQTIDLSDEDLKKHGLQRIEKKEEFDKSTLKPGLYEVFWKSGGSSMASVGINSHGDLWLAPINWVFPSDKKDVWTDVDYVERIDTSWLKARAKIVRRIKELNEGDELGVEKWFVVYDYEDNVFSYDFTDYMQEQPQDMYIKSEDLAKQLIKELEPELKIYLGVK